MIEEAVHKVTLYMTPRQWNKLSQWSANDVASEDLSRAPWLRLEHDHKGYDEYLEKMAQDEERLSHSGLNYVRKDAHEMLRACS